MTSRRGSRCRPSTTPLWTASGSLKAMLSDHLRSACPCRVTLPLVARIALAPEAGQAVRLFTGAAVPRGVVAVVLEERCELSGSDLTVTVPVPAGANIRRVGEDVPMGSMIVEAGQLLDARHIAIFVAAGVSEVEVRRPIRIGVLSNGNELRDVGAELGGGTNPRRESSDVGSRCWPALDGGNRSRLSPRRCRSSCAECLRPAPERRTSSSAQAVLPAATPITSPEPWRRPAARCAGFVSPSNPASRFSPAGIGRAAVLGLPGNPVAAMVNFLLFGRALVRATAGLSVERPVGQSAVTAAPFTHSLGRTEFVPAKIVGSNGKGPVVEKLGRGGSARLRPLVLADGFAEIPSTTGDLPVGSPISFHPFHAAFAP